MLVSKHIIHVIDEKSGLLLNEYEGVCNLDLEKLIIKQARKIIKSDFLRKAKFNNFEENVVKNCCKNIFTIEKNNNAFLEYSKVIATYLYEKMEHSNKVESCDLLIAYLLEKDQKYIAIFKLDYKKLHNHKIEMLDEKLNIQLVENEIAINSNSCITQAAIIGINNVLDEKYFLRIFDIEAEKKKSYSNFITDFLNAEKVKDHKVQTIDFERYVKEWINNCVPDIDVAQEIRDIRDYMLLNNSVFDIEKFIEIALFKYKLDESFREFCYGKEIYEDFNIDKKYIEKKLKTRTLKIDTGFNITADRFDFEDGVKFQIVKNESGSHDIIIKNVLYYEEK